VVSSVEFVVSSTDVDVVSSSPDRHPDRRRGRRPRWPWCRRPPGSASTSWCWWTRPSSWSSCSTTAPPGSRPGLSGDPLRTLAAARSASRRRRSGRRPPRRRRACESAW
jgi:hypothetical protein